MCFYTAGGILNLALAVALSRDALLEAAAMDFRARLKAAKARQRENHIRSRWRAAIRWRLRAKGCPVWIDDLEEERRQRIGSRKAHHSWYSWLLLLWRRVSNEMWREWEDPAWRYVYGKGYKRLNLEVLSDAQLETAALEAGAPLSELLPKGLKLQGRRYPENCDGQVNIGIPSASPAPGDVASPNPWFATLRSRNTASPPSLTHMRLGGMVTLLGKFAIAVTHEFQPELYGHNSPHLEDDGDATVVGHEAPTPPTRTGLGVSLTRTMTMTTTQEEEPSLTESLQVEERIALRVRLGIAVMLFIVFWMVCSSFAPCS